MQTITKAIYPPHEFQHIINYLSHNWNKIDIDKTLKEIFLPVWQESLEKNKYVFEQVYFFPLLDYWRREHSNYGNWKKSHLMTEPYFNENIKEDGIIQFINKINSAASALESTINNTIDIKEQTNMIVETLLQSYPELKDFKPNSKGNIKKFEGYDFILSTKVQPFEKISFPEMIALENMSENELPLNILVKAIVLQALNCNKVTNSLDMLSELKKVHNIYTKNDEKYRLEINPPIKLHVDIIEPLAQCLFGIVENSEQYLVTFKQKNELDKDLSSVDKRKNSLEELIAQLKNRTPEELQSIEDKKVNLRNYVSKKLL